MDDAQIHNPIFPSRLQSMIAQTRKAQAPLFNFVSSENDPKCMPAMSSIPLYSRHNGERQQRWERKLQKRGLSRDRRRNRERTRREEKE